MSDKLIIIDFEASGLGDESYPIEAGWVNRADPGHRDSFLIRPSAEWTYWDQFAEEKIHKIGRPELLSSGLDAPEACLRLNEALDGLRVYSDAAQTDRFWMSKLFQSAGVEPRFSIASVYELIPGDKADAFQRKLKSYELPHRALADASLIAKAMNFVSPPP